MCTSYTFPPDGKGGVEPLGEALDWGQVCCGAMSSPRALCVAFRGASEPVPMSATPRPRRCRLLACSSYAASPCATIVREAGRSMKTRSAWKPEGRSAATFPGCSVRGCSVRERTRKFKSGFLSDSVSARPQRGAALNNPASHNGALMSGQPPAFQARCHRPD